MNWHPKEEDLEAWALRNLERAYAERQRPKCSREDFFDGYMAALRDLRSRSAFKAGRFEAEDAAPGRAAGRTEHG